MARTGRPETPLRRRFLTKFDFAPDSGCWVWTGARHPQGYGLIKRKDGVQLRAHRLAYELAHGPIPEGLQVCRCCDNPSCVRPGHLFLGTAPDNAADMVAKGRSARLTGERNGAARLNRQCVENIRADDRPYRDLAGRFGGIGVRLIGCFLRRMRDHTWHTLSVTKNCLPMLCALALELDDVRLVVADVVKQLVPDRPFVVEAPAPQGFQADLP